MVRFRDLPISEDFHKPVPGSQFSWGGYKHLVRTGRYQAVGPHAKQAWIFHGNEVVEVEVTESSYRWR